jgi:hypothetical protein
MYQDPRKDIGEMTHGLKSLASHITTPEQKTAFEVYLHKLSNDPSVPQDMKFIPLGFLDSLQSAPPVSPPQGTVKDKIEGQLMAQNTNPVGIAANMPQMQPRGPQQPPQQPQQQPPQALYEGGVAQLPVSNSMYNFREGGIIGYAGGGMTAEGMIKEAFDQYKAYKPEAPVDFDAFKQQYIAAHPEATALAKPVGESFGKYLEEQANRDKAEHERQTGEMSQRNKDLGFSNALIAASQQTRGTKGIGSLGPALAGFGTSVNASTAAEDERLNTLNVKKREQDMMIAKYRNELETAQRAAAEGDMTKSLESRNKAIQLANEAKKMGIDLAMHLATPLAQLESSRIMAAKQHATPEAIQLADRLIKENPKLTFEQALNKIAENRSMGQLGSVEQNKIATILKERDKVDADPTIRMGMMAKEGSPQRIAAEAEKAKRYKTIDTYYNRMYGGQETEVPTPTAAPGLLPPPTGKFGVATEVKP